MPLTLRPTGLGSGIDEDRPDYKVYTGDRPHLFCLRPLGQGRAMTALTMRL